MRKYTETERERKTIREAFKIEREEREKKKKRIKTESEMILWEKIRDERLRVTSRWPIEKKTEKGGEREREKRDTRQERGQFNYECECLDLEQL